MTQVPEPYLWQDGLCCGTFPGQLGVNFDPSALVDTFVVLFNILYYFGAQKISSEIFSKGYYYTNSYSSISCGGQPLFSYGDLFGECIMDSSVSSHQNLLSIG